MKRPSPLLLLLAVCCAAVLPACAQAPIPHAVRIGSIEELQAYFTYDPGRDIIVSGHRGGMMPGYPENCIESCEKTLSMMPTARPPARGAWPTIPTKSCNSSAS